MKTILLQILLSGKGRFVSLGTGAIVGGIVNILSRWNLPFDPEVELTISALIALAVSYTIDSIVLHINASGVKQIQEHVRESVPELSVDGYAGPSTVQAVAESTNTTDQP